MITGKPSAWWNHMHYVALSRCTSLQGLHIVDLNIKGISASKKVLDFLNNEKKPLQLAYTPTYAKEDKLSVTFNNVGSVIRKWEAIRNHKNLLSSKVIILAETWLSPKHANDAFTIPGFVNLRMDSLHRVGHRGLLMFIKETLSTGVSSQYQSAVLEVIAVQVKFNERIWNILGCYKPPGTQRNVFLAEMENILLKENAGTPMIVVGDFNVDVQDRKGEWFLKFMREKFNMHLVDTRATTWENTRIDLMFTN